MLFLRRKLWKIPTCRKVRFLVKYECKFFVTDIGLIVRLKPIFQLEFIRDPFFTLSKERDLCHFHKGGTI